MNTAFTDLTTDLSHGMDVELLTTEHITLTDVAQDVHAFGDLQAHKDWLEAEFSRRSREELNAIAALIRTEADAYSDQAEEETQQQSDFRNSCFDKFEDFLKDQQVTEFLDKYEDFGDCPF